MQEGMQVSSSTFIRQSPIQKKLYIYHNESFTKSNKVYISYNNVKMAIGLQVASNDFVWAFSACLYN